LKEIVIGGIGRRAWKKKGNLAAQHCSPTPQNTGLLGIKEGRQDGHEDRGHT